MKFTSIQVLRAIAAVFVVLAHVRAYLLVIGNNNNSIFTYLPNMLGYGAEMFFTISGFLMAYLIDSGYNNFLIRRLSRIYPTFFFVAILAIFFKVITFGTVSNPNLLKAMSLLPFGISTYPLNVEWTLIYEVFFYLICSIFTFGNFKKAFPYFLVVWLGIVLAATLKYHVPMNPLPSIKIIFYQLYNMFFIIGALTYYIYKRISPISQKVGYTLFLPGIIYVVFWHYWVKYPEFAREHFYLFAVCCSLMILGALSVNNSSQSRVYNFAVKMGDYSYALYLVHVPVLVIFYSLYQTHIGPIGSKAGIIGLLLCLFTGWWVGKVDVFFHELAKTYLANKTAPGLTKTEGKLKEETLLVKS